MATIYVEADIKDFGFFSYLLAFFTLSHELCETFPNTEFFENTPFCWYNILTLQTLLIKNLKNN